MASSANTSKKIQISLEKKCADLESQLSMKSKSLDSAEERLMSSEENMGLVIHEKEKQSSELVSFKNANEDLKIQLWDLDKKLKETEAKCRAAVEKVDYYESVEYTAKVIDIFCASMKYQDKEIQNIDRVVERLWNPPPPISPTLAELGERVRRTGTAEQPIISEENLSVGNLSTEAG